MTTYFAIVNRETGEIHRDRFYKAKKTAKGSLTTQEFHLPAYKFAVAEIELTPTKVIPEHKISKTDYFKLLDDIEDKGQKDYQYHKAHSYGSSQWYQKKWDRVMKEVHHLRSIFYDLKFN